MSGVRTAFVRGIADTIASARLVVLAWLANLLVALPLGAAMFVALRDDLGHEIAAERLRLGWDDHWHRAFAAQAKGIAASFDAGIVGMGAVLRALDAQIDARLFDLPAPIVAAGLVYAALWVFLSGGFVARFLGEPGSFFRDAAAAFRRLIVLAIVIAAGHAVVLGPLRAALGDRVSAWTRDVTDERIHFAWVLGKTMIVWGLVWTIALLHDYARVLLVADRSRSIPRALVLALGFVRRHAIAVYGLSAAVFAVGTALLLAYWPLAPGAGASNAFMLLVAFALSQLSVVVRIATRVLGWASAVALLRQRGAPL